ncbi:hypothetical protein Q1695_012559 [Nippostrongylus brasiliensis]|nr:hypothetical protein Q1695_012559 [Nippostrongylus brasiliensis]
MGVIAKGLLFGGDHNPTYALLREPFDDYNSSTVEMYRATAAARNASTFNLSCFPNSKVPRFNSMEKIVSGGAEWIHTHVNRRQTFVIDRQKPVGTLEATFASCTIMPSRDENFQ